MGPAWAREPHPQVSRHQLISFERLIRSLGLVSLEANDHALELEGEDCWPNPRISLTPIGLAPRVNWPAGSTKKGTQHWSLIVINGRTYDMAERWHGHGHSVGVSHFGDASWEVSGPLVTQAPSWRARLGLWRRLLAVRAWCLEVQSLDSWPALQGYIRRGPVLPPRPRERKARAFLDDEMAIFALE